MLQSPYKSFYNRLPIPEQPVKKLQYLLTDAERKEMHHIRRRAIATAAVTGASGVILLYLPQYFYPNLFPNQPIHIAGKLYHLPLLFLFYGGILALLEIVVITFLNIYFVHQTAVATGFLRADNRQQQDLQNLVLNLAAAKTTKAEAKYGINPFLGLTKPAIFTMVALQKAKGMLSNAVVKAIAGRLGGRFALQLVQNLLGIPIYAFWDAWATRQVLGRARAVIMGQNLITHLFEELPPAGHVDDTFKELLYDSLQYIATSKRYFHENHNLLTSLLFTYYQLDTKLQSASQHNFIERIKAAPTNQRIICAHIMITGFLLDERLSAREELHISQLHKAGIIPYNASAVFAAHRLFMEGRSVMSFIKSS